MVRINLETKDGVPQYACNACGSCDSLFAKSLCSIKNRGCCYYFPKFTLCEIHRMTKTSEGLKVLKEIVDNPGTKIYHYYIHAKGYFDKKAYSIYMKNRFMPYMSCRDETIFFRACPFVDPGVGCRIPEKYRSYVCNFFICDEVTEKVKDNDKFKKYIDERESYIRWMHWENEGLEMMLREKGINLEDNYDEAINILKETPIEQYEFPCLPVIDENDDIKIGA